MSKRSLIKEEEEEVDYDYYENEDVLIKEPKTEYFPVSKKIKVEPSPPKTPAADKCAFEVPPGIERFMAFVSSDLGDFTKDTPMVVTMLLYYTHILLGHAKSQPTKPTQK
jgi:hypothetical protein